MNSKNKLISFGAGLLSVLCNPIGIPFVGFLGLFMFSYLNLLPLHYKIMILSMIGCFTVVIPLTTIFLFMRINHWKAGDLENRQKRFVPYALIILSYIACLFTMSSLNMPRFLMGIILSSLLSITLCTIINRFWKISAHMAGMGQLIGLFIASSLIFYYNPVGWLSLFILLAGAEGTCSIIIQHHTLGQVLTGAAIGLVCSIACLLFI